MTFFKGSRYERVGEVETTAPDGREIRYKRVRFIPETPARRHHVVRGDDRIDLLAHAELGNPELFWLICDANTTIWPPDALAEPGRPIGIPDAEGSP